ncbi:MAG: hypothetical protein U0V73_11610 [Acidimicrobiia bacterium]
MDLDAQERERLGLIVAACLYVALALLVVAGVVNGVAQTTGTGFRFRADAVTSQVFTPVNVLLLVAAALVVVAVSPGTRSRLAALGMAWTAAIVGLCGCWWVFEIWAGPGRVYNGIGNRTLDRIAGSLAGAALIGLCALALWVVRSRLLPPMVWDDDDTVTADAVER